MVEVSADLTVPQLEGKVEDSIGNSGVEGLLEIELGSPNPLPGAPTAPPFHHPL